MKISRVRGMEILDSRGNPTVLAEVTLRDGTRATAHAPSGASTGTHESVELRDGGDRYGGKGTLRAVRNIDEVLAPAVIGLGTEEQAAVDRRLIDTDGSFGRRRLGANAVLAVSCAVARAAAQSLRVPLWKHLAQRRRPLMPVPMVNIISGGLHAGRNIDFQDFLVIPRGYADLAESLEAVTGVHGAAGRLLRERGCVLTGVADEGGWGPLLDSNEDAVAILREAIQICGARMDIALDIAASHFAGGNAGAVDRAIRRCID